MFQIMQILLCKLLNPLYENLVNKQDIKAGLLANMLSEQVSQKLFDRGDNRGEDFHMINLCWV